MLDGDPAPCSLLYRKSGSTISVVGNRFLSITDDSFFIYH